MSQSQIYFEDDFWLCVENASPGESPATHPHKWRRLTIIDSWQRYLAQDAYAQTLVGENQNERRALEAREAERIKLELLAEERAERNTAVDARPRVMVRMCP